MADALALEAEEGRDERRYASGTTIRFGELYVSYDPEISEWGNPAVVTYCYPNVNQ